MTRGLRPKKSKAKWYVSFQPKGLTKGTRSHKRLAETFQTEQEAKAFARAKLAEGLYVSSEFFRVLGVQPILGRVFNADDDQPGCGAPGAVVRSNHS